MNGDFLKEQKLREKVFRQLGAGHIKPQGWLEQQLRLQAKGLSGHLDLIWPDIKDSRWIGGDREGWERVPYWLDGFIPLAWLLDDADLKRRAKYYIDAILDGQQEDGWICPCRKEERDHYDVWAVFLICKVLVMYEACSGDERIEEAVYRILKQLLGHVSRTTLFGWGAARWFECLIPLFWLYERRPEPWMTDLAYVLDGCGIDYEKIYRSLSFAKPEQNRYWTFLNHVVNAAMAMKSRAEMGRLTGEGTDEFAQYFYGRLMQEHGMPIGHFTGDECLSGIGPLQGSECCSVVEMMYSCEELLSIGGNPFWGDLLEQEAYNALAATISDDMWTHQYVQMTNQIECSRIPEEKVVFNSNGGEAHCFGLEPNFGCCTANFNQGWPKFALSAVMESQAGLAICLMAPVCVDTIVSGTAVKLRVNTEYPFRDSAVIYVETEKRVRFPVEIRIPGYAESADVIVDGVKKRAKPGTFFKVETNWENNTEIRVEFSFKPEFVRMPDGMQTVRRGALFFALPIEAEYQRVEYVRDGVERKYPYCDYAILPVSEWAYGFWSHEIGMKYEKLPEKPFDRKNPPVMLEAELVPLEWKKQNGMCAPVPESLEASGKPVKRRLYPYGCTTLRMGQMPDAKKRR